MRYQEPGQQPPGECCGHHVLMVTKCVLLRISDIWADKIFVSGNIEAADGDHLSARDNHLPCNELLV